MGGERGEGRVENCYSPPVSCVVWRHVFSRYVSNGLIFPFFELHQGGSATDGVTPSSFTLIVYV